MPHNQKDLMEQVKSEFKSHKTMTDSFNIQRSLVDGKRRFEELRELTGSSRNKDGDSWLNTPDKDDPRGRVGLGWPWDRSD